MSTNTTMNAYTKLDPRIRDVINTARSPSDKGCLMVLLIVVGALRPEKREAAWKEFEHKVGHSIRPIIPSLASAFDVVSAELSQSPSKRRLASVKKKLFAKGEAKIFEGAQ